MATHSSNLAWKIPWTEELGLGGHKESGTTEHAHAPFDPAIPLHDIYPKELKLWTWRDIWTPIFIATLFTIDKIGKHTSCLLTAEWIKKMWGIYIYVYIYMCVCVCVCVYVCVCVCVLEEGMATHSSILVWRIPWTEESGGLQSIGWYWVRHNECVWSDLAHTTEYCCCCC